MKKLVMILGLPVGVLALLVGLSVPVVATPPLTWEGSYMVGDPTLFPPEGWARWLELPAPLQHVPDVSYLSEWGGQCVHWFDESGTDMGNARVRELTGDLFMFVTWPDANQQECETFRVFIPIALSDDAIVVPPPASSDP